MPRAKQFDEQEVLEKAMNLFWLKGYHATSIQDLVDEIGINRASMYHTFGGKEELFQRALRNYIEMVARTKRGILEGEESVKQGFHKLFRAIVRSLSGDEDNRGCFIVNTTAELLPDNSEARMQMEKVRRCELRLFQEYVQKGIDNGEISADKDPLEIATYFQSVHSGLTIVSKVDKDYDRLMDVADMALKTLE